MKKYGFTLAEVLITLVIIGVIAAITVPSIVINANNEATVSKLKKVHSILQQATDMIMMEEGSANPANGGWAKDVDAVYNHYKSHLNLIKDCGSNSGCFSQGAFKTLDGGIDSNSWDDARNETRRRIILQDGTQVLFEFYEGDCTKTVGGSTDVCAEIGVDLNGENKPNTFGRDVFVFALKDNGLFPSGCDDSSYTWCSKEGYFKGWGCTCKVLSENAINY